MKDAVTELLEAASFLVVRGLGRGREKKFLGNGQPVIGIPGWEAVWMPDGLGKFINSRKLPGELTFFDFQRGYIDSYVDSLGKIIENYEKPLVVGFSLGGIIAARYAQKHGWKGVDKIVTIGSPFAGVKWFDYCKFMGGACEDMRPGSDFLDNLRQMKVPVGKKLIGIYSKNDFHIGKPLRHIQAMPFSETHIVQSAGHNDLGDHCRWWEKILEVHLN